MAKAKTKIITLEGTTAVSNKELIWWLQQILSEERGPVEGIGRVFTLTQKPRFQVAQPPKIQYTSTTKATRRRKGVVGGSK